MPPTLGWLLNLKIIVMLLLFLPFPELVLILYLKADLTLEFPQGLICSDLKVEPELQEVPNGLHLPTSTIISDGAHLDLAINGFWGERFERYFVEVRVFNPFAPSNRQASTSGMFSKHE